MVSHENTHKLWCKSELPNKWSGQGMSDASETALLMPFGRWASPTAWAARMWTRSLRPFGPFCFFVVKGQESADWWRREIWVCRRETKRQTVAVLVRLVQPEERRATQMGLFQRTPPEWLRSFLPLLAFWLNHSLPHGDCSCLGPGVRVSGLNASLRRGAEGRAARSVHFFRPSNE